MMTRMPPEIVVSRETIEKFKQYQDLLLKWQKAVNLVGPDTLGDVMSRHLIDSAQISRFLPPTPGLLMDMGSGAGFPGLVLAMMNPDWDVHLVESDSKKCSFLKTVSRETHTPVTIHNARVENLRPAALPAAPAVISARALAALSVLLDQSTPWARLNPALTMLFPKGERAGQEVEAARAAHDFTLKTHQSLTSSAAQILEISGLARRA